MQFGCSKAGYILINPRPITCIREPECKVIKPLGITSGRIPDGAINATSERYILYIPTCIGLVFM